MLFRKSIERFGCLTVLVLLILSLKAEAGVRHFTTVYEATTSAPGSFESENYFTWADNPRDNHRFDVLSFRNEIELGLTDRFQASVYFANWSSSDDRIEHNRGWTYDSAALELIYNFLHPNLSPIGLSVYQEVSGGPDLLEFEWKILLQKNVGRVIAAYNLALEAEWEGQDLREQAGEISQSVGVSYEIKPSLSAGLEFLHEIDLPGWSDAERSVVFTGPNLCYRRPGWWITIGELFQVTGRPSEATFQTRVIVGINF